MRRFSLLLSAWVTLAGTLPAQRVTPATLEARSVPRADTTVALRVGDRDLLAELRVPVGPGPHPVAIVIHGGCWQVRFADTKYMRPLAEALRQAGIATFNISYRRADETGGPWPGMFLDIAAQAAKLRELAPRYALDLRRVIATGHSAGAHLALWLAAEPKLPTSSAVRSSATRVPIGAVVALDGPGDIVAANAAITRICSGAVLEQLLASKPESDAERWREASPAAWLPLRVPQVMVRGSLDVNVNTLGSPEGTMTRYSERARAAGDSSWFVNADTTSHFAMLDPEQPSFAIVLKAMRDAIAAIR